MCTIKRDQLNAVDGPIWSSVGFSPWTDPVSAIYRRLVAVSESASSTSS